MKRYLLFMGEIYYPTGGMKDYFWSFDSIEEAKECFNYRYKCSNEIDIMPTIDWGHIFDTQELKIIELLGKEE